MVIPPFVVIYQRTRNQQQENDEYRVRPDAIVAVRMNSDGSAVRDLYLSNGLHLDVLDEGGDLALVLGFEIGDD